MKCLLDMDGVLVDFVTGACKRLEVDYIYTESNTKSHGCWDMESLVGINSNEFWSKIDDYDFWTNLSLLPDAKFIIDAVKDCFGEIEHGNVSLLSSPSNNSDCVKGKKDYIKDHLPEFNRRYLLGPCKQFCAASNHLLIDDYDRNVDKFREHGGKAILVPRPWNSRYEEYFSVLKHNPELMYDLLISEIHEQIQGCEIIHKMAYYAHCIALYNTKQEERDVVHIESLGYKVYNPNSEACSKGYELQGMEFFKEIIKSCDALVFRANPDGTIPAGVLKEIDYAEHFDIPVIELPSNILRRGLTVDETRQYLKEIGYR